MKIQSSTSSWIRIYSDTASRTADAGRSQGTDPLAGAGVIAEVVTTASNETVLITPGVFGFTSDASTSLPIAVTNNSAGSVAVTVTLTLLQLEV
jgi:hypothetical protein